MSEKLLLENINLKNEVQAYKDFAFKKNMLELSIAFILAGAFNKIVATLSDDIIMPTAEFFTFGNTNGEAVWRQIEVVFFDRLHLKVGELIGTCADFLLLSFSFYVAYRLVLAPLTGTLNLQETTKLCPKCCSRIPKEATKCCYCTIDLGDNNATPDDNT